MGNPALGLGTAGIIAGGVTLAGVGAAVTISTGAELWGAYRAASAAYSVGTGLGSGMAIGGGFYTGGAALGAIYDWKFGSGQSVTAGFDQRVTYPGFIAATATGGLTGMYGTAMFGWAGVPNAINNLASLPGFIIRLNSFFLGQTVGRATQEAVKPVSHQ